MHPNFSPEKYSTDKLYDKLQDLTNKLSYASRIGNHGLCNDIRSMMFSINAVLEERRYKEDLEELKKQGIDINEPITLGEVEEVLSVQEILDSYKDDKKE